MPQIVLKPAPSKRTGRQIFHCAAIKPILLFGFTAVSLTLSAQKAPANDVTAPLHALQPDYPTPYKAPTGEEVKKVLDKIYKYLNATTPASLINKKTKEAVEINAIDTNTIIKPGDYRLTSYEWGVTYNGMMQVANATGDKQYENYVKERFDFLARIIPSYKNLGTTYPSYNNALRQAISPKALDDAGAVCASMIKATTAGINSNLRPLIDNYSDFVVNKEYRLADGTFARVRPLKNTIWLDDMYMAIPTLAQMGKLTGSTKYYDDAAKQVLQFSARMFHKDKNLYQHGWVEGMEPHPAFHWARANGWALMAMTELLDVLPETHPKRAEILKQFQLHAKGLAAYQDGTGFWHQLLDKNDTYLETSATAIYTYCIAHGISKKWLDKKAFGPMVLLAWNAVSTKVSDNGQVVGTCVGTGLGFDPAFYYYRPVNVFAAHSYGPVLLAGAAIIELVKSNTFKLNDSALQAD